MRIEDERVEEAFGGQEATIWGVRLAARGSQEVGDTVGYLSQGQACMLCPGGS